MTLSQTGLAMPKSWWANAGDRVAVSTSLTLLETRYLSDAGQHTSWL